MDQHGKQVDQPRRAGETRQRSVRSRQASSEREPAPPPKRPYWRLRWQGVVRLGLAVGLVGFATVVSLGVRARVEPEAAPVIDRLDSAAVMQTTNCDHRQTAGVEENFSLRAKSCLTFEGGSMKFLDGVTVRVAEQPDRKGLVVIGNEASVNGTETDVTVWGDVQLTVSDGMVVRTATLTYATEQGLVTMHDDAGPTTLTRDGLEAAGRDVAFYRDSAVVDLEGAATVRLVGDDDRDAVDIRSTRATLADTDRYMHFEGYAQVTTGSMVLESEIATLHFGEEETALEQLELRGNARIYPTESASGELRELSASNMTLTFEETTRAVAKATLGGDARIRSIAPAPGGLRGMRARAMTVTFDETTGTPEQAMLAGASTIELVGPDGGAGTRINAETIDVTLAPDESNVTALVASDGVRFELADTQDGPGQEIRAQLLTGTGASDTGLTGVRFEGGVEYRETLAATETGAAVSRVIRAEQLEAGVEEGFSALHNAGFKGDVSFTDDTREASADELVYDLAGNLVTLSTTGDDAGRSVTLADTANALEVMADIVTIRLEQPALATGSAPEVPPAVKADPPKASPTPAAPPTTTNAPPKADAPVPNEVPVPEAPVERSYSIALVGHEVSLDGSTIEASGDVKNVLTPGARPTGESTSAMPALLDEDQKMFVSADALRYDGDKGLTTYTGEAHLWQGDTSFEAETLTMDDRTGNLTASGDVRTTILLRRLNEATQRTDVSPTRVEADTFAYDDGAQRAVYEGTARLLSDEHGDLKADTIEVFLETDGRTLDELQAKGNVQIRLDGRSMTGEQLVYYEEEGRYEMEGTPVVMFEETEPEQTTTAAPRRPGASPPPPSCRRHTGLAMTFYRSTNTVTVDGEGVRRTEMTSDACPALTF